MQRITPRGSSELRGALFQATACLRCRRRRAFGERVLAMVKNAMKCLHRERRREQLPHHSLLKQSRQKLILYDLPRLALAIALATAVRQHGGVQDL